MISSGFFSTNTFLSLLNRTLRVLIIDDAPHILNMFSGFFSNYPIFSVTCCDSVCHAESMRHVSYWDGWIVDLYCPRIEDGTYLMKKYAHCVPIIAISGQASGSEGFHCSQLKVSEFFDKAMLTPQIVMSKIFDISLKRFLFPEYPANIGTPGMARALDVLFTQNPETIQRWAELLEINTRSLENYCTSSVNLSPRPILLLYKLFLFAFKQQDVFQSKGDVMLPDEKMLNYHYSTHTSLFVKMITNRKNICREG